MPFFHKSLSISIKGPGRLGSWMVRTEANEPSWKVLRASDQERGHVRRMAYCLVAKSCLTLCKPMNCSLAGSSVDGISQVRILEWVAISFFRGSSQPRNQTHVSYLAGKFFTTESQGESPSLPKWSRKMRMGVKVDQHQVIILEAKTPSESKVSRRSLSWGQRMWPWVPWMHSEKVRSMRCSNIHLRATKQQFFIHVFLLFEALGSSLIH